MPIFANAIVIDSLVSEPGGVFATLGETIDFDPNDDQHLNNGEPVRFEDGSLASDIIGPRNIAVVTGKVTYEDGSEETFTNLVLMTLNNGQTIVFAQASPAAATAPVPSTGLSPASIEINPFSFGFRSYGDLEDAPPIDLGDGDAAPCFTEGTLIRTPGGDVPVEALREGDPVITQDHGPQVIRWIGRRAISAETLSADPTLHPIRIAEGTLGNSRDLVVSPMHKMLVSGWRAEVLMGAAEVLIATRDMVNDETIRVQAGTRGVTYFHILLDRHEIIFAESAPTESLNPNIKALDAATRREILALFPELEGRQSPAARMVLNSRAAAAFL